jgi:hypothetical protein
MAEVNQLPVPPFRYHKPTDRLNRLADWIIANNLHLLQTLKRDCCASRVLTKKADIVLGIIIYNMPAILLFQTYDTKLTCAAQTHQSTQSPLFFFNLVLFMVYDFACLHCSEKDDIYFEKSDLMSVRTKIRTHTGCIFVNVHFWGIYCNFSIPAGFRAKLRKKLKIISIPPIGW